MTVEERSGTGAILRRALARLRGQMEIFLLLALLTAVIGTALTWIFFADFPAIGGGRPGGIAGPTGPAVVRALGGAAIGIVVYAGIYVIWVRAAMLGREAALSAGYLNRVGMVVWRTICLAGYVLLAAVAFVAASAVLGTVVGILGGRDSAAAAVLGVVLILAMMVALLPVSLAYYVAVVASALDDGMPIIAALKALRGLWRPVIGAFLIGILAYVALALPANWLFFGAGAAETSLLGLGVSNLLGAMVNLYIFSVAMAAYEEMGRHRGSAAGRTEP